MARKRHLHPAQGVYPGFCLFCRRGARGSPRLLSFLPTGRCCLAFPADRRNLFLQASAENHNCLLHAYTRAPIRFYTGKKLRKLYTVAFKSLVLNHTQVYSWPPKLYTNCSPTLHKNMSPPRPQQPTSPPPETGTSWGLPHRPFPKC